MARTARRLGAKNVTVIAQHAGDQLPAGARDLAAAIEEGVKFEFATVAKKVKSRAGKAQGVECVRVTRERGRTREVKGSRFDLNATTVILATGYAPKLGESADYLSLADGSRLAANYYTGRTPDAGVFAAGDAVSGQRSVIHAVASGKRSALAIDAWLGGTDLEVLEEQLAVYAGMPYLEQLKDAEKLGELGARLAESQPVWLKMGIAAEPAARATMPKVGKVKRLSATDVEVEKGYSLAAARAEAMRCLQCECPSSGACDLQKLGVRVRDHGQRPGGQGRPRARGRSPARAPLHPPRHGPLRRLRQVRARVPRRGRPGLLRLHGPGLHHQRGHALQRGPAARRLHQLRPLRHRPAPPARSPSTTVSSRPTRSTRAAASCASSASRCARSTP